MPRRLCTYGSVLDTLDALPTALREARRARGIGIREAATQVGVAPVTIQRMEAGQGVHLDSVRAVLRWLGAPAR